PFRGISVGGALHIGPDHHSHASHLLRRGSKPPVVHAGRDPGPGTSGRRELRHLPHGELQVLAMNEQFLPLMTMVMAFGAVTAVVYVAGQYVATEVRVHRRVAVAQRKPDSDSLFVAVKKLVSTYFDEKRFGLEDSFKAKARRELLRAGFFQVQNVSYYI